MSNKFKECHLTPGKQIQVSAPLIEECPINLECKVKNITPLGSHDMFLAEIVGIDIDEQYLDEDGKLHMEQWWDWLPICMENILLRARR